MTGNFGLAAAEPVPMPLVSIGLVSTEHFQQNVTLEQLPY